jgi:hypothetical protein
MRGSILKDIIFYLAIILLVCYFIKLYRQSTNSDLKCILSDIDGQKYCVRERHKLKEAANLLASITQKCKNLVDYVDKKYPNDENVRRLVERFNPTTIQETLPTSEHTAYSENKGEKLAFCLNKKSNKNNHNLIDENTLMFVALHELSHIMTNVTGHKQVFWQNFKFLLGEAKEGGFYTPVDYKNNPEPYCGMDITDNPYFDLA